MSDPPVNRTAEDSSRTSHPTPRTSSFDVLIVGGGPAGSSCAWALRRAGFNVVVWDRKRFPRDKICAGWITPQILAELELDAGEYAAGGRTIQPISGFRVSRLGDPGSCVLYDHVVSYAIRRCELDHYLLQRSGAALRLGDPVRSLERRRGEWVLNDSVRAALLVGAGGHFCPVAQRLGANLGAAEPIVAAQEAELEMTEAERRSCTVAPEVPEIFFTPDLKGYGWVVRKGNYLNVGLGRQDSQQIGRHVEAFFRFLEERGKAPPRRAKARGHAYLLHGDSVRPVVADAALLIGDAAGLAYPKSGEGIRPAIESGLLAAETIVESGGRHDAGALAAYERRLVARFGERRADRGITDLVPLPIASAVAGRLFRSEWFARRVVLDRWFFHAGQPALRPPRDHGQSGSLSGSANDSSVSAAGSTQ
jgi:geranylgeranyl reductase family protein